MKVDKLLLGLIIFLTLFGILMVYSASNVWAEYKFDNKYYFLSRQALFGCIGFIIMIGVSKIDYNIYKKYSRNIFIASVGLLFLVLVPGIGIVRGGAQSWIGIGSFSLQPSEFVKITLIILLSKYLSENYKDIKTFKNFVLVLGVIFFVFGLIMLQPDFGTGTVLILGCILLLFINGILKKWFLYMGIVGLGGVVALIISAPYRVARIFSFLDPWSDPLGGGFQIIQSLYAITPGGVFGLGLFNSKQKYFYLPEPQTDFIFAIITEELGLIGAILIITAIFILCFRILTIALRSKDLFAQNLSVGIASLLFVQFFINIAVVIGLIPVTGVTLPFLSYGGSSLVITLAMMGIILNISKKRE